MHLFYNSSMGILTVYQDLVETNLLQLFAHPENSEWFSVISIAMFDVKIVAEEKRPYW